MSRVVLRAVVVLAGTAAVSAGFLPLAASAPTTTLTPRVEAWYQPDPTCALPPGCVLTQLPAPVRDEVAPNPYPEGTLHVGYASGAETARSVLAFPLDALPGALVGARLDVPLDVDPASGDAQSASAKVQICLVTGEVESVQGSTAQPPATSCDRHADARYVATPSPHLTADLAALLPGLLTTNGLALLPAPAEEQDADAWHVTFSSHDRASSPNAPAALTVTTAQAQVTVPTVTDPAEPPAAGGFVPDGGFAPAPGLTEPVPSAPPAAPPVVAAPEVSAAAQTVTVGYAYPLVWLLPLALMLVLPMVAKALTKDLAPLSADVGSIRAAD